MVTSITPQSQVSLDCREMASVTQQIASGNTKDAGSNSTDPLTEAKILETHQAVYTAVVTQPSS